jgi:hypothetical protein
MFAVCLDLQATKMVKSALHSPTRFSTTARPAEDSLPAIQAGPWVLTQESQIPEESASAPTATATGSFDLVRKFLEHLVIENAAGLDGRDGSAQYQIDWAAVEASTSDCQTLEQAIGRAVVVADQMSRGVFDGIQSADLWPSYDANDPFFAFSVADVSPDFGDDSRYRRRAVRKLARILRNRNLVSAST